MAAGASRRAATAGCCNSEYSQCAQCHAALPARRRAEGARSGGFRAIAVRGSDRSIGVHGHVGSNINVKGELGCQLVRARLKIADVEELSIAEDGPALRLASGIAGVDRVGFANGVVVGLTT